MIFSFIWHENAIISLEEENAFILKKWNEKEVQKFNDLINENLERLENNPRIGKFNSVFKVYYLVISKQTTLYYNFDENTKTIELYLFWNNLKDPDQLLKLF